MEIHQTYIEPPRYGWKLGNSYVGMEEELFGPSEAFIDDEGNIINDISYISKSGSVIKNSKTIYLVNMEPGNRYGYLKDNYTWLFPPIYSKAHEFNNGITIAEREIDGVTKQFLLTLSGKEILFENEINIRIPGTLIPFNTNKDNTPFVLPNKFEYDGGKAGNWGFINKNGDIIVEP